VTWLTSLGVGRLQADVHPDHEASARVARRLGLVPTSTVVDDEILWEAVVAPRAQRHEGVRQSIVQRG